MEALAVRDGIHLAMDLGFRKVILESDAQEVVRMINVANFERAYLASICYEVQEVSISFDSFVLVHVNWEANIVVHRCARQASEDRRRCLWVNYVPSFLLG